MSESIADLMPLTVAGVAPLAAGIVAFELRDRRRRRVARVHARCARHRAHAERPAAQVLAVQRQRRARPLRDRGQARTVGPWRFGERRRPLPDRGTCCPARCRATTSRSPTRRVEFLFVAGGIGITPIMSMLRHLANDGSRPFKLYYLTRSPDETAFAGDLRAPSFSGNVVFHHDGGDPDRAFDLWPLFERPRPVHVYCVRAAADAAGDPRHVRPLADGRRSTSRASPMPRRSPHPEDHPFRVRLARSGDTVEVGAHQSILEALRAHGPRRAELLRKRHVRHVPDEAARRRGRPSRSRAVGRRAGRQHHGLRVAARAKSSDRDSCVDASDGSAHDACAAFCAGASRASGAHSR